MKVLVVGPSSTKSKGGMATVIREIRNSEILKNDFDIDILSSYIDGNIIVRFLYSVYGYLHFLTCYKKYDLFHIHTASYGSTFRKSLYLKTLKIAGKRAIVHIHGAEYLVFYDGLKAKGKETVIDFLNSADMVLALSDIWKKKFEETFGIKNCYSLNNGIDTEEFKTAISNPVEFKDSFLLLGRLGVRKGAYDLVNAAEFAVKKNPRIKIYMAGDGEIDKVKALVKAKRLNSNIDVVGWIDVAQKIDLLKKVSTVILPSYNEGLPMSILEGMACGKAIISTAVGAIPEVVKEENGVLINPGDIRALAEAIAKCSTDMNAVEHFSKNNLKMIEEHFSIKIMHRKLAEYYNTVYKG